MIVGFGIALLVVCALSLFDRRAMPYAFTLLLGWLAGLSLGWQSWPLISLMSATTLFWLHINRTTRYSALVASLASAMLLADVVYLWFRWQRAPVEVEYAYALDLGLICQLGLVGYGGGINAWLRFWGWCVHSLRGPRVRYRSERH